MMSQKKLQAIMDRTTPADRWHRFVGIDVPAALTMPEWKEWQKAKKAEMPFRFLVGYELVHAIARWQGRLERAWETVLFRTIWRKRYRMLDLRRGDPSGQYRRGYLARGQRFEFAMVALIRGFVEHALPVWEKNGWQDSKDRMFGRAREVYAFWMTELPKLEAEHDALSEAAYGGHEIGDEFTPEELAASEKMRELDKLIEEKKREATLKFFDIRDRI